MKNSSKQNDKCRVTITSIPTVYAVPKKKKRIQILFGLSKTFELKIEYEICSFAESSRMVSELVYVSDDRLIFQPLDGYMFTILLLFEGLNR